MPNNLQQFYDDLADRKSKAKVISKVIKEQLSLDGPYKEVTEEIKVLSERRKSLKAEALAGYEENESRLKSLRDEAMDLTECMASEIISLKSRGEEIPEVTDKNGRRVDVYLVAKVKKG